MAGSAVGRIYVRVLPDTRQFREDLKKTLDRAEATMEATIPVTVEVARESVTRAKEQIKDLAEDVQADVEVSADTGLAGRELSRVARDRIATIHAKINRASVAMVASTLARLSGARMVSDRIRGVGKALSNLDRSLPKIAAVTMGLGSLSAVALASVQGVVALGAGLVAVAGAGLALPGMMAGFAAGAVTMGLALKDAGTVLADLGPKFSAIQKSISSNFWAQAEGPIRTLAEGALPILSSRLSEVGTALGGMFAQVAGSLSSVQSLGALDSILSNVRASVDAAAPGFAAILAALMRLGAAGAAYLTPLAEGFTNIAERFHDFIVVASETGKLDAWIQGGIAGLKSLGSVVASIAGIFSGLWKAASAAVTGNGLTALATTLRSVSEAINSEGLQKGLTGIFESANIAASALAAGVGSLGGAFAALAPTIGNVLEIAGSTVGQLITDLSAALSSPELSAGLTALVSGLSAGLAALGPALTPLAGALGMVGQFAGQLAATLGGVLGAAITALAPVISSLLAALQPLIPLLGGVLIQAITMLAPLLQEIASGVLPILVQAVTMLLPIIAQLIALIGAVLAPIIQALTPILQAVLPIFQQLAVLLGMLVAAIAPLIAQLVSALVPAIVQIITALMPLVQMIIGLLIPVIRSILPIVTTVISGVISTVSALVGIISGVIALISAVIRGDWGAAWAALKQIARSAAQYVVSQLQTWKSTLGAIFRALGPLLSAAWRAVWSAIKAAARSGALGVVGTFLSFKSRILSILRSIPSQAASIGRAIINGIKNGVTGAASALYGALKNVAKSALNAAKSVLGIKSPSREFMKVGDYSVQGFVKAVDAGSRSAQRSMARMVRPPSAGAFDAPVGAPAMGGGLHMEVHGPDAREVAGHAMALARHQQRTDSARLVGV